MTNQMEEDALFFSFAMTGVLQLLLQLQVFLAMQFFVLEVF